MLPDIWGRHLWFSIHFIALDYPVNPTASDRANYQHFFENLWKVIPCYKCSQNYQKHLQVLPLVSENGDYLVSRDTLFAWTVALHNEVNKMLGKPEMSLDDAKHMYREDIFPSIHHGKTVALEPTVSFSATSNPYQITGGTQTSYTSLIAYVFLGILIGFMFMYLIMKRGTPSIKYLKK